MISLVINLIISLIIKYIYDKYNCYDKRFNYKFQINTNLDCKSTYNDMYSKIYDDLFYNKERYDFETNIILNIIKNNFKDKINDNKIKDDIINDNNIKWLDLACGTSKHYSNSLSNIQYIGLDKSKYMLNQAIKHNTHKKFINYNLENLDKLKGQYDIITSFYCGLFYVKNIEKVLNDIYNKLNGYLIIVCLDKTKLENLTLKLKYKNKIIRYEGKWENIDDKTYYREYFYERGILIYYNEHIMYLNIEKFIKEKFKIVKKIEYKNIFDAGDEYMLILKV